MWRTKLLCTRRTSSSLTARNRTVARKPLTAKYAKVTQRAQRKSLSATSANFLRSLRLETFYSVSQPHQFPHSISLGEKCTVLSDFSTHTNACSVRWLIVTCTMTPLPEEYEQSTE